MKQTPRIDPAERKLFGGSNGRMRHFMSRARTKVIPALTAKDQMMKKGGTPWDQRAK